MSDISTILRMYGNWNKTPITSKGDAAILEEYSRVVRNLKKGYSLRETSKLSNVAVNTVRKVKACMVQ